MARNDILTIARTLCQLSVRIPSAQYSNTEPRTHRDFINRIDLLTKRIVAISDIELPASMQQDSSHFDLCMDSENRAVMRRSYPSGVNLEVDSESQMYICPKS